MKILRKITSIMALLPLVFSQASAMESASSGSDNSGCDYTNYDYYFDPKPKSYECVDPGHQGERCIDIKESKGGGWKRLGKDGSICQRCALKCYLKQIQVLVFKKLKQKFGKTPLTKEKLEELGIYAPARNVPSPVEKLEWWPRLLVLSGNLNKEKIVQGYQCPCCLESRLPRNDNLGLTCIECGCRICDNCRALYAHCFEDKCPMCRSKKLRLFKTNEQNVKLSKSSARLLHSLIRDKEQQEKIWSELSDLEKLGYLK